MSLTLKYAYYCRTGNLDIWALCLSNVLSAALTAFSVLLRPTTAAQPFASSWPLLAPGVLIVRRSRLASGVTRVPSTHKLGQATSNSRYRTATIESWLAGHRLSWPVPTARSFLPSVHSPTAGPPAHTRTATLALLSLKCRLPSAVSTFGPDKFRPRLGSPAVSFARLP